MPSPLTGRERVAERRRLLGRLLDDFVYRELGALVPAAGTGLRPEQEKEWTRLWGWLHRFVGTATGGRWTAPGPEWEPLEVFDASALRRDPLRFKKDRVLSGLRMRSPVPEGQQLGWRVKRARARLPMDEIGESQRVLRGALGHLVAGRNLVGKGRSVRADDLCYDRTLREVHLEARLGPRALGQVLVAPLPDAILMAALAVIEGIPAALLRRCSYQYADGSTECGRVFVGVKAQRWCKEHGLLVRREQLRAGQERWRKRAARLKEAGARLRRRRRRRGGRGLPAERRGSG